MMNKFFPTSACSSIPRTIKHSCSSLSRNNRNTTTCSRAVGWFSSSSSINTTTSTASSITNEEDDGEEEEMIVRMVPTSSSATPIERIMKAWSEEESHREKYAFTNILAWTKTFQETSSAISSSSSPNKRLLLMDEATSASHSSPNGEKINGSTEPTAVTTSILAMLDSPSLLLPRETLIFLLRNVAQHSQNTRKTTEVEGTTQQQQQQQQQQLKLLKELQHVSSSILLRLVTNTTTQKQQCDTTTTTTEGQGLIDAWNYWIQCLVDDDPTDYPLNPQQGMPASTMAQNIFHLMTGNPTFTDITEEERKHSSSDASTIIANSPKYQLYHYLLRNFSENSVLQPNIETFNAVMEHIARDPSHESRRWTSAKHLFQWLVDHPTLSFTSYTQVLRTFQILFQSMPRSATLKTKKNFLRQLNIMLVAVAANATTAGEQPTVLYTALDLIPLFNACMKHCSSNGSIHTTVDSTAATSSILPPNPNYPWEHPWDKSWVATNITAKQRKHKKWMDDARHTEDWVQFMIDHHHRLSSHNITAEANLEQEDEEEEGIWMIPPPNITSYECVIQGWVRTGTLFGLLRAQEWFIKLWREHLRNTAANKGEDQRQPPHWCEPTISTIYPILSGWAWADFDQTQTSLHEEGEEATSVSNNDNAIEIEQIPTQNKDSMSIITPIIVEDWIFQLVNSNKGRSESQEVSSFIDQPVILLMTTPIIAWRNFIRQHYLNRHLRAPSLGRNDAMWATKRCVEWLEMIESLLRKKGERNNEGDSLMYCVVQRSAYAYAMDAIAFMILHSSKEEEEVEEEGIQYLFNVMDSLNSSSSKDAYSGSQRNSLPLLYGQCVRHFSQILQKLQKTRNDEEDMNHMEHEFLFRIEKMLHMAPIERRDSFFSDESTNKDKDPKNHNLSATTTAVLEDILLKPTWIGRSNDYRFDKEPMSPSPLTNAHHNFYREILKYIKRSGSTQAPHQKGHAIRISMSIVDRLTMVPNAVTTTSSQGAILEEPVDSTTELFKEVISCIGMVVVHRAERAEILERVYKQYLSASSMAANKIDHEGLQNAIIKAMGGKANSHHFDGEDLIKRLQVLQSMSDGGKQHVF